MWRMSRQRDSRLRVGPPVRFICVIRRSWRRRAPRHVRSPRMGTGGPSYPLTGLNEFRAIRRYTENRRPISPPQTKRPPHLKSGRAL